MARSEEQQREIEETLAASTINQRKAFLFAFGWQIRKTYGFRKYPEAYDTAKKNIGLKSLVFNVPSYPKKYERGSLSRQMRQFYEMMYESLQNNDYNVQARVETLLLYHSGYFHRYVSLEVAIELWYDTITKVVKPDVPFSSYSKAFAKNIFDKEVFEDEMGYLCDSLEDSGHMRESDHLRTGRHTPACPVLRQIAGIK